MKKVFILLSAVLVAVLISADLHAQMTKQEKKEWKKKAKQYKKNPEALRQIETDNQDLSKEVADLENKVSSLESQVSDKNATISDLQAQIQKLRSDVAAARKQAQDAIAQAEAKKQAELESGQAIMDGVVFKVQIGAFRNKDLSKYFENHENFSGETDEDGTQKITLGQFRDYWEADTFKKYLREMGVKDAWIVPYRDGQRVDIKDVLEGVVEGE